MKKIQKLLIPGLMLGLVLSMSGCGSSKSYDNAASAGRSYESIDESYYATDDLYEESAEYDSDYEMSTEDSMETEVEVQDTSRKLIREVTLNAETEEFDKLLDTVTKKLTALGGYVENSNTYNGSRYNSYSRTRSASLTIRIPAEKLDEFLNTMTDNSNITSRDENVRDVTLQYVDMASHKKALQAEQERLLELMEKAETIEDLIALEERMSDVRYQIESMEAQLRTMDNQVSYSTVYLNIDEVEVLTPVEKPGFLEKVSTGFVRSLAEVGEGFINVIAWFIICIPFFVVWAIVIVIIVMIVKAIRKGIKKRKAKKLEKQQKKQQMAEAQTKAPSVEEPEKKEQEEGTQKNE